MKRQVSTILIAVLIVLVAVLAYDDLTLRHTSHASSTGSVSTTTTLFSPCQASTFRGTYVYEGGTAGTVYARIYLTNFGEACSMHTYPQLVPYGPRGVVAVSSVPNNRFIEHATPSVPSQEQSFDVSPGTSVGFALAWSDLPSGASPMSCAVATRMEVGFGVNGGYTPAIDLASNPMQTCGTIIVSSIYPYA